jgi:hypothetical protein
MAGNHARLSPSNHRWTYCPGSVREEEKYEKIVSTSAVDGTGSHLLLELCLNQGVEAKEYIGRIIGINHEDKPGGWLIANDRAERVQMCLDYIERRKEEIKVEFPNSLNIYSETKSNPGIKNGRDDWWGTVDVTLMVLDKARNPLLIEVIDLKDGRGYVDVNDNPQLISYLAGKVYERCKYLDDCPELRITIVQPKTNPCIRYQDLTIDHLHCLMNSLSEAAKLTDNPDAVLIADTEKNQYCKWCSHKNNCQARKNLTIERLKMFIDEKETSVNTSFFDSVEQMFKDVTLISDDSLSQLLDSEAIITDIFYRVREEIEQRILAGIKVPGYAILPGRTIKKWKIEEAELVKILKARKFKKEDIYLSNLISPSQFLNSSLLTQLQKEKIEKEYIEVVPGKESLKPVSRKEQNAIDLFKDVVVQCKTVSFI